MDYVECISDIFIGKYQASEGKLPAAILYNRYMTGVNRGLIDEVGTDIRLPHCWYRWGDEVVRYTMPYIDWNQDDPRETLVSYNGRDQFGHTNDSVIAYAGTFADDFIAKYSGPEGMEKAIDDVYENVPYRFQNNFRMLRENLKISKKNVPIDNHADMVASLYRKAMDSFPDREFKAISKQKDEFCEVFQLALDKGLSPDRLQDISECFWFYFCYHLRLDRRGHHNVPDTTLSIWRDVIPENLDRYEMMMQNYVSYLCPEGSGNPVLQRMLEDRQERLDDIERLFEEMES